MNWLAHLFLSEPNPAFRIGNLLPDLARPSELSGLSAEFMRGIHQHRRGESDCDCADRHRWRKAGQFWRRIMPVFTRISANFFRN
jgi:acyl carrier protein phosphodiesterase